jgi:hypothetical protein
MNPISRLSDDHRAVLLDIWGMLDLQNPLIDTRSLDWSVDTCHLGLVEKSNIVHDLANRGIVICSGRIIALPESTLNNINKFLFE